MRTKDSRINSTNQNPTSIDLRRVLTFGNGFRFFPDVTRWWKILCAYISPKCSNIWDIRKYLKKLSWSPSPISCTKLKYSRRSCLFWRIGQTQNLFLHLAFFHSCHRRIISKRKSLLLRSKTAATFKSNIDKLKGALSCLVIRAIITSLISLASYNNWIRPNSFWSVYQIRSSEIACELRIAKSERSGDGPLVWIPHLQAHE